MNSTNFPILIITGRPAAGKSEVIDFLKKTSSKERLERFHIADFEELDDFLYVWESFEIDDILSRNGKPRVWSDEKYWFKDHFTWNLYIERIGLEYRKKLARNPMYHDTMTTLVEFARGGDDLGHLGKTSRPSFVPLGHLANVGPDEADAVAL